MSSRVVSRVTTRGRMLSVASIATCSVGSGVGNGEGSAAHVVGRECAGPGSSGEVGDHAREPGEAESIGVGDDGDDEALVVEVDGDAEVYGAVRNEVIVADGCVAVRIVVQRVDDGAGDEGERGESRSASDRLDGVVVAFDGDVGVRGGGL
jgi:hypothetical protein